MQVFGAVLLVYRKLKPSLCLSLIYVTLVFAKAIHCLSRIGDELYLEALSQGVSKLQHDHVTATVPLNRQLLR